MHKYDRIFKSTAYLMILTIFVKLIGFVKQAVIAYYFGTSEQMDIYLIAADFISEIGTVFFSTLSINLLTVYVKEIETGTKRDADRLVSNVFVCFAAIALGLSTLVWLSDDLLVKLLAPGFSANEQTLLSSYLRYLSIVILNICISNICIAILNGQKKFIHGKLIGFIQSICMILSCVFFGREEGNKAVIIGFISYYILQNIYLVWNTTKYVSFKPYKLFQDDNVKKLVKLCVPLFISNAVVQVNVMADKAIASYLQDGSVSAISYGHYIFSTIHVVIVGSLCTVVLSYFSAFIAKNEFSELVKVIQKGVYILLFILVPVVIVCIINSELIIRIIYGRGSFGEYSISITSRVFCGYAIGIIFVAIRDYFIQVLYALQAN